MIKYLISGLILVLLLACSVSGNLSRKYEGKGVELLYRDMGEPKNMITLDNGNRLFIYEKETFVRQTEIGVGRGTLDPRVSPSFEKVEVSRFEVDNKGIIVRTEYEKKIKK
jgi:hypothetical protein